MRIDPTYTVGLLSLTDDIEDGSGRVVTVSAGDPLSSALRTLGVIAAPTTDTPTPPDTPVQPAGLLPSLPKLPEHFGLILVASVLAILLIALGIWTMIKF